MFDLPRYSRSRHRASRGRTPGRAAEPAVMAHAREVTVLAAGGTIAMAGARGAVPAARRAALIAAIPELAGLPGLRARTLGTWPGVHVTAADALDVARAAVTEAASGRGVVITHGTDTLEETAVLVDLLHGGDAPIVVTGAIRPASAAGADGPANLLDAVRAAGAAETAGLGVLVCFAGELHAARRCARPTPCRRTRSPPRAAARSGAWRRTPSSSPARPCARPPLPVGQLDAPGRARPGRAGLRRDARPRAVTAGVDGLVAVLLGAGHAPPAFLAACRSAAERIPVVATVRPQSGRILRGTYGFDGAERDVRAAGLILAPACSPAAARITLLACLGAGHSRVAMAGVFATDDP